MSQCSFKLASSLQENYARTKITSIKRFLKRLRTHLGFGWLYPSSKKYLSSMVKIFVRISDFWRFEPGNVWRKSFLRCTGRNFLLYTDSTTANASVYQLWKRPLSHFSKAGTKSGENSCGVWRRYSNVNCQFQLPIHLCEISGPTSRLLPIIVAFNSKQQVCTENLLLHLPDSGTESFSPNLSVTTSKVFRFSVWRNTWRKRKTKWCCSNRRSTNLGIIIQVKRVWSKLYSDEQILAVWKQSHNWTRSNELGTSLLTFDPANKWPADSQGTDECHFTALRDETIEYVARLTFGTKAPRIHEWIRPALSSVHGRPAR